jgi:hypothetical protein
VGHALHLAGRGAARAYNGSLLVASSAVPGVDERTLMTWARTDRIFWPALLGLLAAGAVAWWALGRMRRAAAR